MKVLIVGGVAGGASIAARLRRLSEDAEIIMFERGEDISFANCGIPYYIGDVIKNRQALNVVSEANFRAMLNVDVRSKSEVISIDRANKKVTVLADNKKYEETYDKLVLSPGAEAIKPPIPGIDSEKIFTVRSLTDMDKIKNFINEKKPKKAVVVGGGFIGIEMAENLHHLGLHVSVIELCNQVMNILDYEMATLVHRELHNKNIGLYLGDGVAAFGDNKVKLQSGRELDADLIILSIGVKPEIKLAKDAALNIGECGGIIVNEYLETNDSDIYALGDVIEIKNLVSNEQALVPLANSANKQGRIVADNIMKQKRVYKGTTATAIVKVFDMTVATTGISEKNLKQKCDKVYLNPFSHANYYPNAFVMTLKLLFDPKKGRILGAQIVGNEGVDKRIDILAAMIQNKKTVYDLAELELAYAPPYSSAKDPVNLAGMIAINKIEGRNPTINWNEIEDMQKKKAIFLDVRSALEYKLNHIENAINISLVQLRERHQELPKDKPIIVYCNQGKNAYFAISILKNKGYENVFNLDGGINLYKTTQNNQEYVATENQDEAADKINVTLEIDAVGLQCPGPIMRLSQEMKKVNFGEKVRITVTDPGFKNDIAAWCKSTNNKLICVNCEDKKIFAVIEKKDKERVMVNLNNSNNKTIVVFSSDLDRALAAFVIANGAAAMDSKVTLFFTFWGLNILRKNEKVNVKKSLIDKMFGKMMPKGISHLTLSKMNMLGLGTKMMKYVMKKKNIESLEALVFNAKQAGVRLVACQMSMDMMGIKEEELIDGVEIGGVAQYLSDAEQANLNLFI